MVDEEVVLPGNTGGAVRVGDTVRRPTGPWTPAVHALLEFLHPRIPCVPKVFGFDDQGREVIEFLPGTVVDFRTEALTDGQLTSLTRWTKSFHNEIAGFSHPGPWRYFPIAGANTVGHNDIGPFNVCFDGDELAGVFDWDMAGPSTRLGDLAFLAWTAVPLAAPREPQDVARRLRLLASVYAGPSALEILRATPPRIQVIIDGLPRAADAGDAGMANLVRNGVPHRCEAELAALQSMTADVASHLA
ncbi:MAG: phosphotransferase [Actinomycetes bacterium]